VATAVVREATPRLARARPCLIGKARVLSAPNFRISHNKTPFSPNKNHVILALAMPDTTPRGSDYETQDRVSLLQGALHGTLPAPDETRLDMDDPSTLVPEARQALVDIMRDPGEKASDRREAADSILDRYGEPRRKFEMGGGKTLNIQLPPEAVIGALGALSSMFAAPSTQPLAVGRGESESPKGDAIDVQFTLPPRLLLDPVHDPGLSTGEPSPAILGPESEGRGNG